ncbi:imidazole glycerol phosphate synthase subunit HisH 1 [Spirochaetia bacterium]|nr:imidazole glycerol phosphate synthase subunit HisH 1 [Spirochaetia bacterium]
MKVTIIDYGLSNLLSVQRAVEKLGGESQITQKASDIENAEILILPGVGAFADGMAGLNRLQIVDIIRRKANEGTPLLGICLGMQLLFDESEEFGLHQGLGLIPGRVVRISDYNTENMRQRVPHVGWNVLMPPDSSAMKFQDNLLKTTQVGSEVYFVHSFEVKPQKDSYCIADTFYGGRRICACAKLNNVYGVQFHPEKSSQVGLDILGQFLGIFQKL